MKNTGRACERRCLYNGRAGELSFITSSSIRAFMIARRNEALRICRRIQRERRRGGGGNEHAVEFFSEDRRAQKKVEKGVNAFLTSRESVLGAP